MLEEEWIVTYNVANKVVYLNWRLVRRQWCFNLLASRFNPPHRSTVQLHKLSAKKAKHRTQPLPIVIWTLQLRTKSTIRFCDSEWNEQYALRRLVTA